MTDWKRIAEARGIPYHDAHAVLMEQLETTVAAMKQSLPADMEPAPAFAPIRAKESE